MSFSEANFNGSIREYKQQEKNVLKLAARLVKISLMNQFVRY